MYECDCDIDEGCSCEIEVAPYQHNEPERIEPSDPASTNPNSPPSPQSDQPHDESPAVPIPTTPPLSNQNSPNQDNSNPSPAESESTVVTPTARDESQPIPTPTPTPSPTPSQVDIPVAVTDLTAIVPHTTPPSAAQNEQNPTDIEHKQDGKSTAGTSEQVVDASDPHNENVNSNGAVVIDGSTKEFIDPSTNISLVVEGHDDHGQVRNTTKLEETPGDKAIEPPVVKVEGDSSCINGETVLLIQQFQSPLLDDMCYINTTAPQTIKVYKPCIIEQNLPGNLEQKQEIPSITTIDNPETLPQPNSPAVANTPPIPTNPPNQHSPSIPHSSQKIKFENKHKKNAQEQYVNEKYSNLGFALGSSPQTVSTFE